MNWAFGNGCWAAKHEGEIYGIEVSVGGMFTAIYPDGTRGAMRTFLNSAKEDAANHADRRHYTSSNLSGLVRGFVSSLTPEQVEELVMFFPDMTDDMWTQSRKRMRAAEQVSQSIAQEDGR